MIFQTYFARMFAPVAAITMVAMPAAAQTNPDLAKVEAHLAATQSMTANFVQTDSKNRSLRGTLQIKRPGKIRFEYGRGANMLLVGNGKTLTFVDYEVGQKSSWPVAKSPLSVLLASNPDLQRIARVVASKDSRVLLIRARDARRPEFGTILLGFVRNPASPGGLLLEGWTAIDAQNKRTTVKLDGQRYNVAVAENAFTYAEPQKRRR
ncbi:MAG: outer membrane lipoprotein carrier protein LolA [Sphingomicrobium sp.]